MEDGVVPRMKRFYSERPGLTWALVLLLPLATLAVGTAVAPEVFWDKFLWEDIWGPTVSDARQWSGACLNTDGGIVEARGRAGSLYCQESGAVLANEGYTITSEITYGLVLAVLLYFIYTQVFQRFRIPVDGWFILALMPYILLGPFGRVLEDANVFIARGTSNEPIAPFAYIFISPWIYMAIALFTLTGLGLGVFLARRRAHLDATKATLVIGAYVGALVAGYIYVATRPDLFPFTALARPLHVGLVSVAAVAFYWVWTRAQGVSLNLTLATAGIPLVTPAILLVFQWVLGFDRWAPPPAWRGGTYLNAGLIILAMALGIALLVGAIAYPLRRRVPVLALYANPLNLALIFSHMMDGLATWLAIKDPFDMGLGGYGEKHPVSAVLLDYLGGALFPLAKFVMIVLVIYLLDKEFKDDLEGNRNLVGLVKMAILVLGFAPGLRDVLRVMMGL